MNVFITGGSGYIGVATIAALTREGHTVEALVRSDSSAGKLNGAKPVRGALTELDVLQEAAGRADAVIHLAADYGPDAVQTERDATAAMLDGIGGGPFIHTGGVWVYGDTDGVADETAPLNPPGLVAWREASEASVMGGGGHPVLVMPGLVYGDHAGLIETFFAGEPPISYIGDGSNHWPLVHRRDLAELYVLALDAPAGARYVGVGAGAPERPSRSRSRARARPWDRSRKRSPWTRGSRARRRVRSSDGPRATTTRSATSRAPDNLRRSGPAVR
jgi:nucleoside-diphosphate-sugar epimerase